MNSEILSGNYLKEQDNIDLGELLDKFNRLFKFHENHHKIKENLKAKSFSNIQLIYNQMEEVDQIREWEEHFQKLLRELNGDFPFQLIKTKAKKGQVLEPKELIYTFQALKTAPHLSKIFKITGYPQFEQGTVIKLFKNFLKECDLLFDFKSFTLITYKHPKLKSLDTKLQEIHKEIRSKLAKISHQWASDELLQQNEYDVLDDKFVLPVRSDRYHSNLGRIIHRSNTGNTLFIEPFQLRDLSNKKEELSAELEREKYKLLKALSDILYDQYKALCDIFSLILGIDQLVGRLKSAKEFNLSKPLLNQNPKSPIDIQGIFHPLISNPITNNVKTIRNKGGILISGPNTGGKTVLLKALCLCYTLPHLGFYVPASSAEFPLSNDLHFLSHDNQSLKDGLSSFSSEAINYINTIKNINDNSILFIDEIFNTTSSLEASELAAALIKQIINVGAKVYISSHHETLKEIVFQEELLESAHMGFTAKESRPTYHLHMGSPGKSFAKEVFLKIENDHLDHPLISRWLGITPQEQIQWTSKISDLDKIREDSLELQEHNKKLKNELELEKEKIKNLLKIERQKLQSQFDKKWRSLKKETLDLTEKIKRGEVKNIVKVSQTLNQKKEESFSNTTQSSGIKGKEQSSFQIGDSVFIKALNKQGKIVQVNRDKFQVEAGSLKSWVKSKDILFLQGQRPAEKQNIQVHIQKDKSDRGFLLDARGMRREPFLNQAESHILDVLNGDIPFVDIIHGHGDGILKRSLNELLQKFKDEIKSDHIEGNMGTTRIELLD